MLWYVLEVNGLIFLRSITRLNEFSTNLFILVWISSSIRLILKCEISIPFPIKLRVNENVFIVEQSLLRILVTVQFNFFGTHFYFCFYSSYICCFGYSFWGLPVSLFSRLSIITIMNEWMNEWMKINNFGFSVWIVGAVLPESILSERVSTGVPVTL